jgi:hypothetical protein
VKKISQPSCGGHEDFEKRRQASRSFSMAHGIASVIVTTALITGAVTLIQLRQDRPKPATKEEFSVRMESLRFGRRSQVSRLL